MTSGFTELINPPQGFSQERPILEHVQSLLDNIDKLGFAGFNELQDWGEPEERSQMDWTYKTFAIAAMTTSSLFSMEPSLHIRTTFMDIAI